MKLNVGIESVEAEVKDNILVIQSAAPLTTISSAVLNGGLKKGHGIINVHVPEGCGEDKNDEHWNAENFLNTQVQKLGLAKETVGLMTAAEMKNLATATRKLGDVTLTVFVTAGVTVAVTAGEPAASKNPPSPGTINIILLVDGDMTDGCMVEAHKTITEAKTVALRELDLRSQFSGDLATGTLTDTVAVACTKKGEAIPFAGTFTLIGELIAQCVRQCVKEAIYKQEHFAADRPLVERLAARGVRIEDLLSQAEAKMQTGNGKRQRLKQRVEKTLADGKVATLVLASLRFDDDLSAGLIPTEGKGNGLGQADFERVVTTAIRNYLSGSLGKGQIETIKQKLPNERNLGPLTTCVLQAILKEASLENAE